MLYTAQEWDAIHSADEVDLAVWDNFQQMQNPTAITVPTVSEVEIPRYGTQLFAPHNGRKPYLMQRGSVATWIVPPELKGPMLGGI